MWIVILNRKDYLENITVNGKIEIYLKKIYLEMVGCILLAVSRDQRLDVLNALS